MQIYNWERWSARASGRVAASPLRLARKRARSTSPAFGEGELGFTSKVEGRIAVALEFDRALPGEVLDAVDRASEVAETGQKFGHGLGARGRVHRAVAHRSAEAGDLAGPCADEEMQRGFEVDDRGFEFDAIGRVTGEFDETVPVHRGGGKAGNLLTQRGHALTHRIGRKQPAKDDPEKLHGPDNMRAQSPAESAQAFSTIPDA